jgi:hypothetical protein
MNNDPNENPPPASANPQYEGPALIAETASSPTPEPGYVLVGGTLVALQHNACTAASGIPCEFTWSLTLNSGAGSTSQSVPAFSIRTVTATQVPIAPTADLITTWVDPPSSKTSIFVYAQDVQSSAMGPFGGLGNCD